MERSLLRFAIILPSLVAIGTVIVKIYWFQFVTLSSKTTLPKRRVTEQVRDPRGNSISCHFGGTSGIGYTCLQQQLMKQTQETFVHPKMLQRKRKRRKERKVITKLFALQVNATTHVKTIENVTVGIYLGVSLKHSIFPDFLEQLFSSVFHSSWFQIFIFHDLVL